MIDLKEEMTIKALTGVRGTGKTTLLSMFADVLRAGGMPEEQLLTINFEETRFEWIQDFRQLYDYVHDSVDAMIWATSTGLINGIGQGDKTILSPQTKASRAQIASIIMRYAES